MFNDTKPDTSAEAMAKRIKRRRIWQEGRGHAFLMEYVTSARRDYEEYGARTMRDFHANCLAAARAVRPRLP